MQSHAGSSIRRNVILERVSKNQDQEEKSSSTLYTMIHIVQTGQITIRKDDGPYEQNTTVLLVLEMIGFERLRAK